MLIIKKLSNQYYQLDFRGKDGYDLFTHTVGSLSYKRFNEETGLWETNETGAHILSDTFHIPYLENIGQDLKLQPFEYQKETISEALSVVLNTEDGGGCLLKLPCGAGKTPIGIGLYHELRKNNIITGKGLIVVKASIKIQWPKEIEKFSSYSSSILDTSSGVSSYLRIKIRKLEKRQQEYMDKDPYIFSKEIGSIEKEIKSIRKDEKQKFKDQFDADLLIANYETLNDSSVIKQLKKEPVEFVYADEIHVIKSPSAKRSRSLYKMNYVPYVFGATATPIQKNPVDVYSIYKFLKPGLFKDVNTFKSIYVKYNSFGFPIGAKNEDILNKRIKPYLVIKTQDEVSKELPELQVIPKYCILTPRQKHITEQLLDEIEDIKSQQQSIVSRYSSVDEARKQNAEMVKLDAQILAKQTFAQEIADSEDLLLYSDSKMAKQYITGSESGKIQLLLELMDEIFLSGEKVCVFSKYKRLQPILDAAILNRFKDIQIAHVNSDVSEEQRYEEIYTKFRDTDSCKVLLMSDAGAEGSNLERCQYLIEFEPADSYLIQTQRRGRIVRASSTHKTVYVYQLICEDSYDEIALKIVDKKRGFMHDIIES